MTCRTRRRRSLKTGEPPRVRRHPDSLGLQPGGEGRPRSTAARHALYPKTHWTYGRGGAATVHCNSRKRILISWPPGPPRPTASGALPSGPRGCCIGARPTTPGLCSRMTRPLSVGLPRATFPLCPVRSSRWPPPAVGDGSGILNTSAWAPLPSPPASYLRGAGRCGRAPFHETLPRSDPARAVERRLTPRT
jgi:hypothetical protein